jgi:hypothetical protein
VAETLAESTYWIVSEETKHPYKQDNFKSPVSDLIKKADFTGRTFQDHRCSAVVRFAQASYNIPEIASITGHSMNPRRTDPTGLPSPHQGAC